MITMMPLTVCGDTSVKNKLVTIHMCHVSGPVEPIIGECGPSRFGIVQITAVERLVDYVTNQRPHRG
jgi:hypothetical protein